MKLLVASAFILALVTSNSAEFSNRGAERVGLGLGLPLNSDRSENRSIKAVPDFLLDVHACWSSQSATTNCFSYLKGLPNSLEAANVVWAIKGTVLRPTKVAVLSRKLNYVLMTPFDFKFNLTLTEKRKEKIQFVYINVPKRALSRADLEYIKSKCDIDSGVQLQLHIQLKTPEATQDIVTLSTTLTSDEINQQVYVNFSDITQHFQEMLVNSSISNTSHFLQGRIVVGGACYGLINPAELGIGSTTNRSPWIVVIGERDDLEKTSLRASLLELAAETTSNHQTRDTSHMSMAQNNNQSSDTEQLSHSDTPCHQYTHTVSFRDLGWDEFILAPETFHINYCSGRCNFPLINSEYYNTTKRSYLQGVGAYFNPELIPQPCCVPHEYSDLSVIYFNEIYEVQNWKNIAVKSCGCK